jgi:hypothetical protein
VCVVVGGAHGGHITSFGVTATQQLEEKQHVVLGEQNEIPVTVILCPVNPKRSGVLCRELQRGIDLTAVPIVPHTGSAILTVAELGEELTPGVRDGDEVESLCVA